MVQEFLWLTQDVKVKSYKLPLASYLAASGYPVAPGKKGFNPLGQVLRDTQVMEAPLSCFGPGFTREQCCSAQGRSQGSSCWDDFYTFERCCEQRL